MNWFFNATIVTIRLKSSGGLIKQCVVKYPETHVNA